MADTTNDQASDQKDFFSRMKDFLFAHKALEEVSGKPLPHPAGWMSEDNSGVAKAAAEAGARNEADKAAKAAQMKNRVQGPASK